MVLRLLLMKALQTRMSRAHARKGALEDFLEATRTSDFIDELTAATADIVSSRHDYTVVQHPPDSHLTHRTAEVRIPFCCTACDRRSSKAQIKTQNAVLLQCWA